MRFDREGVVIDYEEIGEGRPLVHLHGFPLDREVMKGCMEPILSRRDGYRRIYLDLPGMGRSPVNPKVRNSDHMLEAVSTFIAEMFAGERILLVGESYGAYLARGIIHSMAERVSGMLLICPLILAQDHLRDLPKARGGEGAGPYNKLEDEEERKATFAPNLEQKVADRYDREIKSPLDRCDNEFAEILRGEGYPFSFDVDDLSRPFPGPVLILVGRQDYVVGYRDQWNVVENFPHATFAVVDGAGHYLQVEMEDLFNCLVNDWLDRVESVHAPSPSIP